MTMLSGAASPRLDATRRMLDGAVPARQRAALEGWIALAERGPVSRADLAPALFGRTLQYVALVEPLDEGEDFRHLIEGREIVRRFGRSGAERFSALYAPEYFRRLQSLYLAVRLSGRPVMRSFMVRSVEDEELAFSQLILPSVDGAGSVAHCAVVFDFPDPIRSIPVAPLRIIAPWRRLARGRSRETMLADHRWR